MSHATGVEPRILDRSEHPVSRRNISENTLKVLYRLHRSGHKAYLVGGGVRDLMLGRQPKDFDVVTDARPNEIRRLFRNSRLIGRRFRLAHVYFKGELVEVATFRREPDPEEQESGDEELLITSDNTYGTPEEDAFRRDFTINALFYDIGDYSVIDYTGGIEDLERRLVRTIGEPAVRFREDPVRMMRACEFAGRLDFGIAESSQEAIRENRDELTKASVPRLTEEVLQLLRSGAAGPGMQWMLDLEMSEIILPEVEAMLAAKRHGLGDLTGILSALDRRISEGTAYPDAVLLGSLLLPQVMVQREEMEARRGEPLSRRALERLVADVVSPFFSRFHLSRSRGEQVNRAIVGFLRLCEPTWTEPERLRYARRPYFGDSLALFDLLVEATGEGQGELEAWRQAEKKRGPAPKQGRPGKGGRGGGRGGGGRRRRRKSRGGERGDDGGGGRGEDASGKPRGGRRRKRRRRRRS